MSEKTKEQLKKDIKDLKKEIERKDKILDIRYKEYIKLLNEINEKDKTLKTLLSNIDIYQFNNKYTFNSINSIQYGVKFKLKHRIIYLDTDEFSNLIKTFNDIAEIKYVRSEIYSKI